MHAPKTSKVTRKNYVLLWGDTDAFEIDFTAFITKHPDGTFKLGFFEWSFSSTEKLLLQLAATQHAAGLNAVDHGVRTLLADELNQNLYSLYHVGELLD